MGQLQNVDMLFIWNSTNNFYGSEYTSALSVIKQWVEAGGILIIHDRHVESAEIILPGGEEFGIFRDFSEDTQIQFVDVNGSVALGSPGDSDNLNNSSLDNGTSSNHGFALRDTLQEVGAVIILTTNDPDHVVTFGYEWGEGAVVYSSIPLDFYLSGAGNTSLVQNMTTYATNLIGAFVNQGDIFG